MVSEVVITETPLSFEFRWQQAMPAGGAVDATRGRLSLAVGGLTVWGSDGEGFPWTWIELLEYLARHWSFIEFEEVDPLGFGRLPHEVRAAAEREWLELSQPIREKQEVLLWNFELSHNLAVALEGVELPDVWILRQGQSCSVVSGNLAVVAKADAVMSALTKLGDSIANRLAALPNDQRAAAALKAWEDRTQSNERILEIATSLPERILDDIRGDEDFTQFWELDHSASESELVALARSSGEVLTAPDLRTLLLRVRTIEKRSSALLPPLESEAASLDFSGVPWEDGYIAARWLRGRLKNSGGRVDPEGLLRKWNVEVVELQLASPHLDAVAVWGPRHGPAVLVNSAGQHAQDSNGRRATFAHEICHLLLDRRGAVPLGEVIGGRVPERAEARARAFAAEFLAPGEIVGRTFATAVDPDAALERLKTRYGASSELLAWQAKNSGAEIPEATLHFLASKVSRPWTFSRP